MNSTELGQVTYLSHQDGRTPERGQEQPKTTYYTAEDQPPSNRARPPELRQVTNRVFGQGERLVRQSDPGQQSGGSVFAHDFESQSHRRSEMVLPSIERDVPNRLGDLSPSKAKTRQVNPFGSYQSLNRGTQHLPTPSVIDLDDHEELPRSKRRRFDDQQPVNARNHGRTILIPIDHINDGRVWCERPHEAAYRDDTGNHVSDKRIVPLPPKEERPRPPLSHQELQLVSPLAGMERHADQVADCGERYPQPRNHYQAPLSRSENVENLQFPFHAVFAPPEYRNDSPLFSDFSQSASKHHERSDLDNSSRYNAGAITDSDRVHAASDGIMRRLQPLDVGERSMPSRFSDMSVDHRQCDDDRRLDRVNHLPLTAMADIHRHTRPSPGALTYSLAITTANVHGHAIHLLTYMVDAAKDVFYKNMEPPTNAYSHDISERQPAATKSDHPHIREQHLPALQHQPVWPVKQNTSLYGQHSQAYDEPDQANPYERRAPPITSRAVMEPWSETAFEHGFD